MLEVQFLARKIICFGVSGLLLAVLIGCQYLQDENYIDCKFIYTAEVKGEVVIPALKERHPDLLSYFNVDNPAVVASGDKTKLIISATNRVDGRYVMYENSVVFVFGSCSNQLIETYEVVRN